MTRKRVRAVSLLLGTRDDLALDFKSWVVIFRRIMDKSL